MLHVDSTHFQISKKKLMMIIISFVFFDSPFPDVRLNIIITVRFVQGMCNGELSFKMPEKEKKQNTIGEKNGSTKKNFFNVTIRAEQL